MKAVVKDGQHGEVLSPQYKGGPPTLATQHVNMPQSPPVSPQGPVPSAPPAPVVDQPQPPAQVPPVAGKPVAGPAAHFKDKHGPQKGTDDWAKFESDDEKHGNWPVFCNFTNICILYKFCKIF